MAPTVPDVQEIGRPVPAFSLPFIAGGPPLSLDGFLDGRRGAVLLFWSGVCPHCDRYDGYCNTFGERHPELALVAIASRQDESVEVMRAAAARRRLTFPILHDASREVARQWHTRQTPRAYLVDAGRSLLYRGAIDNFKLPADPEYVAYLEPAIAQFLAGQPVARPETPSYGCAIQSVYYLLPKIL